MLMASVFYVQRIKVEAADEPLLTWERTRTMDISFNKGNSVRGSENLLFSFDVRENGLYELEYYLKNGEQTKVYLYKQLDKMEVYYTLNQNDGGDIVNKFGNPGDDINMNQVDYSGIPTWVNIDKTIVSVPENISTTTASAISFDIEYTQSTNVTGFAFELGNVEIPNRRFIADWDRPNNKMYIWMNGYVDGNIMPIKLTKQGNDGSEEGDQLYILKNIEGYNIRPVDSRDIEENLVVYDGTNPEEQAGSHPGVEISFKHPKTWNSSDWTYEYSDIDVDMDFFMEKLTDSSKLLEFEMGLNKTGEQEINVKRSLESADYIFDSTSNTYKIFVAKEDIEITSGTDNTIVWENLESSTIYNAAMYVNLESLNDSDKRYQTDAYTMNPYTFLEYKVIRTDDEAYLDIKPYYVENAQNINYAVKYGRNVNNLNDWSTYYPTRIDEDMIRIVVTANWETDDNFYQVVPEWKGAPLDSQILNYQAAEHEDSGLIAPRLPELIAPRGEEVSVFDDLITFDLKWVGMRRDRWIHDAIYYEVLIGERAAINLHDEDLGYDVFALYKITQEIDGNNNVKYVLERVIGKDSGTGEDITERVGSYDSFEKITGQDGVMLKNDQGWTKEIDTNYEYDSDLGTYMYSYEFSDSRIDLDLEQQQVYYLRMRAIGKAKDKEAHMRTDYSVPKSITLSETIRELPSVEIVLNEPLVQGEDVGTYLQWQEITKRNEVLRNYIRLYLNPQRETAIDNNTDQTAIRYKVLLSESRETLLNEANHGENLSDDEVIDLSSATATIDGVQRKQLQEGEVLVFDVPTNSIGFLGLDENKVYYSRVIMTLVVQQEGLDVEEYYSEPSEVISIITPTLPEQPDETELDPLAPKNFDVRFKGNDLVRLETEVTWNAPDGVDIEGDSLEFEIVAFEEEGFPNFESATEVPLMDVYENMLKDEENQSENIQQLENLIERGVVQGWYVTQDNGVYRYQKLSGYTTNGQPIYEGDQGICRVNPDSGDLIILEDQENRPNQVYYYYIRSISRYNTLMKSTWRVDTITTGRIQTATNLTFVYDEINDAYYETVIRFDIPLEATYSNEIHIREDKDPEYVIARAGVGQDNSGDYRYQLIRTEEMMNAQRLYYRITGLKSGTYYSLKIRLIDDTLTDEVDLDGNPAYPESAFSNTITTRTDFNQDDYEEDLKYQQYLDYYRDQAEKLKQKPYFQLETKRNSIVYKYRDAYGIGTIENNRNRSMELMVANREQTRYYLPAEFLKELNAQQVTLVYEQNGQKVSIRPTSIGQQWTSAIRKMQEEINQYNAKNRAYFIELTIDLKENLSKVASYDTTSPQIQVSINVIGSEVVEEELDIMFLYELDRMIASKEPKLIDALTDELEKGISDARLVSIVQTLIKEVEEAFWSDGQQVLEEAFTRTSYRVDGLDKPLLYTLTPTRSTASSNHKVFQNSNNRWNEMVSAYVGNRYQIQTPLFLPLILANSYMDPSVISAYEQKALDSLSRYNLLEVIQENHLKNSQTVLNNQQFIQVMARILGATKADDTQEYLKSQGIDVPRLSAYNDITNETAYYLYIQTYAKKNHINLSTVRIRNYQIIEDINQVNSLYRDTILRGVNGEFVVIEYGLLNPKQPVTIERLMKLLSHID